MKELNEKSKVNISKIVEAEQERDNAKQNFSQTTKDSEKALSQENFKLDFEILARLIVLVENSLGFYQNIANKSTTLFPEMDVYRNYVANVILCIVSSNMI